ncbi:MAG: EamA family transporter [Saprospiraceae bacterium]|nr:EamA family transporter [Saprospiraceae bacterium]
MHTRAYLSLAAICLIWGTTYTAIKFAIRDFPPYLLVFMRQTAAGLILLGVALALGKFYLPDRKYLVRQCFTGLCTITGGNGFITWGMQHVPSGLASIIGSLTPIVVLLINLFWGQAERPNRRMLSGILLGFIGVVVIFSDGWQNFFQPDYVLGVLGCFGSCLTWSLGTVMAKRWNAPGVSPVLNAGLQITAGGLGGGLLSLLFDRSHVIHHTFEGWAALLYLVVFGSALAFTLYMYALKHLSAMVSSLYTYINPIVAIVFGWLWLNEHLTAWELAGMGVTLAGVWLVNQGARLQTQAALKGPVR